MGISISACDHEKERSKKILEPEIDLAQDFHNVALARVLFTGSTFFKKIMISGYSWRKKLIIRMRDLSPAGFRIEDRADHFTRSDIQCIK